MSRDRSIFSHLVSQHAYPVKPVLQRTQVDFPRNSIFWEVQLTGMARLNISSPFTVERFQLPLHNTCDSRSYWGMTGWCREVTIFIPSLVSLGSRLERFPLILIYLTKSNMLKWTVSQGNVLTPCTAFDRRKHVPSHTGGIARISLTLEKNLYLSYNSVFTAVKPHHVIKQQKVCPRGPVMCLGVR